MYSNTSQKFINKIESLGGRTFYPRLVCNDFTLDNKQIKKIKYNGGSNGEDNISIGTAVSAYIEITTKKISNVVAGQRFLFEIGLDVGNGCIEYIPMGYFKAKKPTTTDFSITFQAYDKMQEAEKKFISSYSYPTNTSLIMQEISNILGVNFDTQIEPITLNKPTSESTEQSEINIAFSGYTVREVIAYIAGLYGKFAIINRIGNIEFKWYEDNNYSLGTNKCYLFDKNETEYIVEKIVGVVDNNTNYTVGYGKMGIIYSNPFLTEDILRSIYSDIGGFSYRGGELRFLGDCRLDPWDIVSISDLFGNIYKVPVMQIMHDIDGGISTTVKAVSDTNNEDVNNFFKGPTTKALERTSAELFLVNQLIATKASIDYLESNYIQTNQIDAISANIENALMQNVQANYATIQNLNAVNGKIDNLSAIAITTSNIDAEIGRFNYVDVNTLEAGYAKIDFANVTGQVVSTSLIQDGAITDAKIASLSANKITAGTLDASKIYVTNLNADNITTGTINGQLIGSNTVDLDKLSQEVPTKSYIDNLEQKLQNEIDNSVRTYTSTEIPNLNNYPTTSWDTTPISYGNYEITHEGNLLGYQKYENHVGDICYVVNPNSQADGYSYRFVYENTTDTYYWTLIKDSDVTKIIQDIIDIQGNISGLQTFETQTSSWISNTDDELSSLKIRTTNVETSLGSKVETSIFNELSQTVDENTSSITSISSSLNEKADGSTVKLLTNTVNAISQTTNTNTSKISSLENRINNDENSYIGDDVPKNDTYPASEWNDEERRLRIGTKYYCMDGTTWEWSFYNGFIYNDFIILHNEYQLGHYYWKQIDSAIGKAFEENIKTINIVDDMIDDLNAYIVENYATTSFVNSSIEQTKENISLEISSIYATNANLKTVDDKFANVYTIEQTNSAINLLQSSILSTVSSVYSTKEDVLNEKNDAIEIASADATSKANQALLNANANTANVLLSYSTTNQVNSAINQSADSILSTVSETYITQANAQQGFLDANEYADIVSNEAQSNAENYINTMLNSYLTTSEVQSAINQSADSIVSTIESTYTTKQEFSNLTVGAENLIIDSIDLSRSSHALYNYELIYGNLTLTFKKSHLVY